MCQLSGVLIGRAKIFIIWYHTGFRRLAGCYVGYNLEYVSYDSVLNHSNLVNMLSAKGLK